MISRSSTQPTATAASIPRRILLVVFFVLQIYAAVGLTKYLPLGSKQKAVNQLASQLRTEVSRLFLHLDNYLAIPYQSVEVLYEMVMLGSMSIRQRAARQEQLDEKYIPFAHRLNDLAQGFQEKAIVALVGKYLELEEVK